MRRKDREIVDRAVIDGIIEACEVVRLGFYDADEDEVYIVPVNFGYDGEAFYIHGAKVGHKIDLASKCSKAGFELDIDGKTVPAEAASDYTYNYRSVIGSGPVELVEDPATKLAGLQLIMKHHSGRDDWDIPEAVVNGTAVIKLTVDKITCKANMPK